MDKAIKVIEGVGEVGIDTEASPGNGQYYVKLYDGSYDAAGFESLEAAEAEMEYLIEEDYEPEWDGQPDEAQEWYDFDPDC